jgi:hypothetical protein
MYQNERLAIGSIASKLKNFQRKSITVGCIFFTHIFKILFVTGHRGADRVIVETQSWGKYIAELKNKSK